ncbi:MAG TPA: hypothetical protein PLT38_10540, partial [Rubrivivax sp.]|nr:hypothetical protein [Rubrivivax sp.]
MIVSKSGAAPIAAHIHWMRSGTILFHGVGFACARDHDQEGAARDAAGRDASPPVTDVKDHARRMRPNRRAARGHAAG